MQLNQNNYFSAEAGSKYMSVSQYKQFRKCEAMAYAELMGEYSRPKTSALLAGGYVDAHFSGFGDKFRNDNPEMFKKDGSLKAEFIRIQNCIDRLEREEWIMEMFSKSEKQRVITGGIAGVPFKAMCDFINDKGIIDLKCMKDFEDIYNSDTEMYEEWWKHWGYDIQGAVYLSLFGGNRSFGLVAVSKESSPDIKAINFGRIEDAVLYNAMVEVEYFAPRYQKIKEGKIKPVGCGKCDYCKSIRKIDKWENIA